MGWRRACPLDVSLIYGARTTVASAVLVALLGLSCGGPAPSQTTPQSPASGRRQAPPKPGTSITHTKMCACTSCDPPSCCQGDVSDIETEACRESYDFSASESCGMSVKSCASRCFEHHWRVPLAEDCEATQPDVCCG